LNIDFRKELVFEYGNDQEKAEIIRFYGQYLVNQALAISNYKRSDSLNGVEIIKD